MNDLPDTEGAVISEAPSSGSAPAPSAVSDSAQEHEVSTREAIEKAFAEEELKSQSEKKAPAKKEKEAAPKAEEKAEPKVDAPSGEDPKDPESKAVVDAKGGNGDEVQDEDGADQGSDDEGRSGRKSEDEDDAPPARFRLSNPESWAKSDPEVRSEIKRAITELEGGIEKYRPSAERYEQVRQFDEMAQKSGTTLPEAMSRYVQTEMALMSNNPQERISALNEIVEKTMGESLYQVAQRIARMPQDQVSAQKDREIVELKRHISSLTQNVNRLVQNDQQSRMSTVHSTIQEFAKSHPDVYEHEDTMVQLMKSGIARRDLADAYQKAKALSGQPVSNPSNTLKPDGGTSAKTSNVTATSGRSRASKSISGASSGAGKPSERIYSTREALELAFAQGG